MEEAPITKDLIRHYVPHNAIIVEAGAHIGRDTIRMATLWPDAHIHAFEPVPALFDQLTKRASVHVNVSCYNLALSDHIGAELLFESSGASSAVSSFYEPYEYIKDRPNVFFRSVEVPTTTLDRWAEEHHIFHVDALWLDMQGAELKVLMAAPKTVATVKVMVLEASLTERFKGIPLFNEVVTWVTGQGFKVIQKDAPKHNKVNMLCVRQTEC